MKYASTTLKAVVTAAVLVVPLAAQGTFTAIGTVGSRATGISGDGSIIVGSYSFGGGAWRWSESAGLQDLGGDAPNIYDAKISRDGKTIVYADRDSQGLVSTAIWQGGRNWKTLGGVPEGAPGNTTNDQLSFPEGVSADGSVIVGLAWLKSGNSTAFRWDSSTGMVSLPKLRGQSSSANTISANGWVIAGWDDNHQDAGIPRAAVTWWNGLERLVHPYSLISEVIASNPDGGVLVGKGYPQNFGHAFRWLSSTGQTDDLGSIVPPYYEFQRPGITDSSTALGVTDDGSIVVGTNTVNPVEAMVWTPSTKMVPLAKYLTDRGVQGDFLQWVILYEVTVISPDGRVMAGSGVTPQNIQRAFVVRFDQ
jgi:probable HAF family extracellular repeat protein